RTLTGFIALLTAGRLTPIQYSRLFPSQSHHRINSSSPARRYVTSQQGNQDQKCSDAYKCERVGRAYPEQEICHRSRQHQRTGQTNPYAKAREYHSFPNNQLETLSLRCPKSHTNADLLSSLCRRV